MKKEGINKKIIFWCSFFYVVTALYLKSYTYTAAEGYGTLNYVQLEPNVFSGFNAASGSGDLGAFLSQAFQFGLAIAAALAVIMIVWGGVKIMLSESLFNKEDGKKKVEDAIWGLLLALVSWLILYTINPEILNWTWLAPK